MQTIDINSLKHSQVYTLFEVYNSMFDRLSEKAKKTAADDAELSALKLQLNNIEEWARKKMAERLHWTKEEILLNYGNTPTLIISFHPGSDGYLNYGKKLVANIEFSEEELLELFQNIQNKVERKAGIVKFQKVPEMENGEFSTYDIFEIGGRNI